MFCPKCGSENSKVSKFCIKCGNDFSKITGIISDKPTSPKPSYRKSPDYAGLNIRVAANTYDYFITFFLPIFLLFETTQFEKASIIAWEISVAVMIAINWLYFSLQESSPRQATIGKRLMGIYVTDTDGGRLSFLRSTARFFTKILSAIPLGIGFLMIGRTQKKQGLHDKISGTVVVRESSSMPVIKKTFFVLGIIIFVLLTVGFFWGLINPVVQGIHSARYKKHIMQYSTNLKAISALETQATEGFNSVTGNNFTNDEAVLSKLETEVIPAYSKFSERLKGITPEEDELKTIHLTFIKASGLQLEAFMRFKEAIEKKDKAIAESANKLMVEERALIDEYSKAMKSWQKKHLGTSE